MDVLDKLAALTGIEPEYFDRWGARHVTPARTKRAVLKAMGINDPEAGLRERELRPWNRFIEPVMVVSANGQPPAIPIHFPLKKGHERGVSISWQVTDEAGGLLASKLEGPVPAEEKALDGARYVRVELPNETGREIGYYQLDVKCRTPERELSGRMRLVIAPDRCWSPPERTWGISLNLYSLRSGKNWGVGDLADLKEVLRWVGRDLGGGFVGINPLHAIPNAMPEGISPYLPTSRLYRNFLYVDMADLPVPEQTRRALGADEFLEAVKALRGGQLIDYEGAASLKIKALKLAFSAFDPEGPEGEEFKGYVSEQGKPLEAFATFMALTEQMKQMKQMGGEGPGPARWQDWPEQFRGPDLPAVSEFRESHGRQVMFYQFLQWLLDRQLRAAQEGARQAGMDLGLYADLAVGSSGQGSDAWSCPELFAMGVTAGAPPDAFNIKGQDWGFPPFVPERARESGYELFIQTIRQNIRHAGALRVDHALGLFRLFWIPEGMTPREGTYVTYPHEDLLRIIALESVRNRAVIIAEDLGTIGEKVREALESFGMLSYRLLYFERDWPNPMFLPPGAYPEMALTAVTTHDLPTLSGYWAGRDIEVKSRLGIYPDEKARQKDLQERDRDRQYMLEALKEFLPEGFPPEGFLKNEAKMTPELFLAVHAFLARTPCRLVSVSLDDIEGVLDQQNLPGLTEGHPNWRRKAPVTLQELIENGQARALAGLFRRESRSCGGRWFPI
jgi:4-alpha-glucanotransferase